VAEGVIVKAAGMDWASFVEEKVKTALQAVCDLNI